MSSSAVILPSFGSRTNAPEGLSNALLGHGLAPLSIQMYCEVQARISEKGLDFSWGFLSPPLPELITELGRGTTSRVVPSVGSPLES